MLLNLVALKVLIILVDENISRKSNFPYFAKLKFQSFLKKIHLQLTFTHTYINTLFQVDEKTRLSIR